MAFDDIKQHPLPDELSMECCVERVHWRDGQLHIEFVITIVYSSSGAPAAKLAVALFQGARRLIAGVTDDWGQWSATVLPDLKSLAPPHLAEKYPDDEGIPPDLCFTVKTLNPFKQWGLDAIPVPPKKGRCRGETASTSASEPTSQPLPPPPSTPSTETHDWNRTAHLLHELGRAWDNAELDGVAERITRIQKYLLTDCELVDSDTLLDVLTKHPLFSSANERSSEPSAAGALARWLVWFVDARALGMTDAPMPPFLADYVAASARARENEERAAQEARDAEFLANEQRAEEAAREAAALAATTAREDELRQILISASEVVGYITLPDTGFFATRAAKVIAGIEEVKKLAAHKSRLSYVASGGRKAYETLTIHLARQFLNDWGSIAAKSAAQGVSADETAAQLGLTMHTQQIAQLCARWTALDGRTWRPSR